MRERIDYLGDAICYYRHLMDQAYGGSKKNRTAAVRGAAEERGKGHVRRLCGIAEISPKHYYSLLKGPEKHSLSYRHMVLVSRETGKKVNRKHVLRVMREEGPLSSVRRRRDSEEVYSERRKLKGILT